MFKTAIILLAMFLAIPESSRISGLKIKVERDDQLVVPGFGAEQILLGNNINDILKLFRQDDIKIIKPHKRDNLLEHVFKTTIYSNINFDKMYWFQKKRIFVLTKNKKIISVVSMNVQRVTIDSVDLGLGVRYFLKSYKKNKFIKYKSKKNLIYNSNKLGIGIIDDGNDDIIDLYFIFPKLK